MKYLDENMYDEQALRRVIEIEKSDKYTDEEKAEAEHEFRDNIRLFIANSIKLSDQGIMTE